MNHSPIWLWKLNHSWYSIYSLISDFSMNSIKGLYILYSDDWRGILDILFVIWPHDSFIINNPKEPQTAACSYEEEPHMNVVHASNVETFEFSTKCIQPIITKHNDSFSLTMTCHPPLQNINQNRSPYLNII